MEQIIAKPQLSFSEAFNSATSRIFDFSGRSRRSEFWWVMALVYAVNIFLTPILGFFLELLTVPLSFRRLHDTGRSGWWCGVSLILRFGFVAAVLYDVISYLLHILGLANVSRLYDYDTYGMIGNILAMYAKYGLWGLAIIVYQLVLLVFYCLDSEVEENDYGESPKYEIIETEEGV